MPRLPPHSAVPERRARSFGFQDLVRHRVHDVLLVSSPYESFILAEDGQPHASMLAEFLDLNIHHIPGFRHVPTGSEALALARETAPDLVIASMHVGDMDAATLARRLRQANLQAPVVILAYDSRDLGEFVRRADLSQIDRAFLWQGDARIFLAIVKYVEDRLNLDHDTGQMGVQAILLVEDNIRYYSSFLPAIYAEVIEQSRKLVPEGLNLAHKLLRFQARPKIVLCSSFEEARRLFSDYQEGILGVISDVEFPRHGQLSSDAGVEFARLVRSIQPDVPIILHSRSPAHHVAAESVGASFLLKGSPLLLQELRRLMSEYFCFGDFVFRLPDGSEVGRAQDLRSFEEALASAPAESLAYHAERNHFSKWLKARTEFAIAQRLRPMRVAEFASLEDMRELVIRTLRDYRAGQGRQLVSDFNPATFDPSLSFSRLGGGSLGGKARGLAFVNLLLSEHELRDRHPGVRIAVPPALVLGTDIFDEFLRRNDLSDVVMASDDDPAVAARVLEGSFPASLERDLGAFLSALDAPLAVRSSSLLEDSQYQPFAGIYETHMLSSQGSDAERLAALLRAIKLVYASTFGRRAKAYLAATGYRLEEEKMAVILQRVVGAAHGRRFYPDFAGVARSRNFYPLGPMRAEDGIAAVALGFGEAVVDGERCFRFCPRHPRQVIQFSTVGDWQRNSQRLFFALDLDGQGFDLRAHGLEQAEADGTLDPIGSTWSAENDAIYDGLARPGVRLVSFAGVLKHGLFPLAEILDELLEVGAAGLGGPAELEFAVRLSVPPGAPREFGFLQLRPLVQSRETADVEVGEVAPERVLCRSDSVLGHGRIDGLSDLVVVDYERFERSRSVDVAAQVARFNAELAARGRSYLLVGVGRWGSAEPYLGIPVSWDQIAGARVIVEAGFRDFRVTPSQGSHFFQNLTAQNVGYFTVNPEAGEGALDWPWLLGLPAVEEGCFVRRIELGSPLRVLMDGRKNRGVILKPEGR